VKGNICCHEKTRKASNSVVSGYYGIWAVYSDVLQIPKSHFGCLGCHPGLHPDTSVQIPYSLSHESDKHPSHDILHLLYLFIFI
jgi:hypothetical protein